MSKPKTNTELVEDFMEFSQNGAMSQIFVMEAINRYADTLDNLADEQIKELNGGIVDMGSLQRTAREWKKKYNDFVNR